MSVESPDQYHQCDEQQWISLSGIGHLQVPIQVVKERNNIAQPVVCKQLIPSHLGYTSNCIYFCHFGPIQYNKFGGPCECQTVLQYNEATNSKGAGIWERGM
jgi:hypothetical protein